MKKKTLCLLLTAGLVLAFGFVISLLIGKYPLSAAKLLMGDEQSVRVFFTLRLPRTMAAVFGGFGLGVSGMIYQVVFRNPLASPDMIGVSSGASAGAAFSILFLAGSPVLVTAGAFIGSLIAVMTALLFASVASGKSKMTIVLSGLAIHSLAQTVLMTLKLTADPERELASIEYWIMGGLNGITMGDLPMMISLLLMSLTGLFLLYRQVLLLSGEEDEAALLGLSVRKMRFLILLLATLSVAAVVSVTGVISFVGLLAPHIARMLLRDNRVPSLWLSGLLGGILLCLADMMARSVSSSELPVSIFTSLLGAPFLLFLLIKKDRYYVS